MSYKLKITKTLIMASMIGFTSNYGFANEYVVQNSVSFIQQSQVASKKSILQQQEKVRVLREKLSEIDIHNQKSIGTPVLPVTEERILALQNALADELHQLAVVEGRVLKANSFNEYDDFDKAAIDPIKLETGDILVIKPKPEYAAWWADLGNGNDGWQHAEIYHTNAKFLAAVGLGQKSRLINWSDFSQSYLYKMVDKAVVIKFDMTSAQHNNMLTYQTNNQINVPYPSRWSLLNSKYSTDTFYCSSLAWRAHKSSGEYNDLDRMSSPKMVWPVELINNASMATIYSVSW